MPSFASPRFAGDPLLEDILNDPDTGTLKLQPGSPPDSVIRLQQALFDLCWTERIDTPVTDPAQFVIGIYGPLTQKTVVAYKTRYGIHFPPDAPTGLVDGLAGPRTFQQLDRHCVMYDEADAVIAAKARQVTAATGREYAFRTRPVLDTNGAVRLQSGGGDPTSPSRISARPGLGAFLVADDFFKAYQKQGEEAGPLGFPVADAREDGGPGIFLQQFEHGSLRINNGNVSVRLDGVPPGPFVELGPGF
ncbi:LGFP repeat-containing protein [Streptomyces sp. NPDC059909]|uniref:LGFP repeat-containing protein n=1 Tax=Streptomyces sp. NPDC059909 TaxID=3346998 RepID=UPI0036658885